MDWACDLVGKPHPEKNDQHGADGCGQTKNQIHPLVFQGKKPEVRRIRRKLLLQAELLKIVKEDHGVDVKNP